MSRPAVRVGCWRCRVTGVLEEWPSRLRACPHAIQNPAYRLADVKLRASGGTPSDARQASAAKSFCRQKLLPPRPRRLGTGVEWRDGPPHLGGPRDFLQLRT